ncbi:MAG TPA: hypothetical protein VK756_06725 [Solirubrobacteraceae bacterium]|nr:hypothetical protein [Solirubrobacteraceae bacterium]
MKERLRAPWAIALAVSIPLTLAYLLWSPPSGDLAAATYRANLLARAGFTLWDNGWYGGHYLPGYSLLSPALGALLGERALLALSVVATAGLFGVLVARAFGAAGARVAAGVFALGISVELLSGRVAYDLGLALALLALIALQRRHAGAAVGLALITSAASPVAGAFLALAALAAALAGGTRTDRRPAWHDTLDWRAAAVAVAALVPVAAFAAVFPEGGYEPFAPSVFWPGVAGVVAIALVLPRLRGELRPRTESALRWGAWLYAAALVGSYALRTPVGSNAARLGELVAAPLVAGALWERRRLALVLLAPVLLYWQLETPISDVSELLGDPSVSASYYAPLVAELQRLGGGAPLRVEIPQTGAHWESVYVPREGATPEDGGAARGGAARGGAARGGASPTRGAILLARGWERQLDTRYAALFYGARLTAGAYRAWLAENAVAYVALPDVRLDYAATAEGALIADGLPYLREVWRAPHWRVFAVRGATPLAQAPAALTGVGADWFALRAPARGSFEVRVRFTPYWALRGGAGCVSEARGGWTLVRARAAGTIGVGIDFSPARVFAHGARCRA